QPHDPEEGTDGARAGGQEGADGEGLGPGPDAVREEWCKGSQDGYHLGWQIHGGRLQGRWLVNYHRSWATPPWFCQPTWQGGRPDNCPTWPKPSLLDACVSPEDQLPRSAMSCATGKWAKRSAAAREGPPPRSCGTSTSPVKVLRQRRAGSRPARVSRVSGQASAPSGGRGGPGPRGGGGGGGGSPPPRGEGPRPPQRPRRRAGRRRTGARPWRPRRPGGDIRRR